MFCPRMSKKAYVAAKQSYGVRYFTKLHIYVQQVKYVSEAIRSNIRTLF